MIFVSLSLLTATSISNVVFDFYIIIIMLSLMISSYLINRFNKIIEVFGKDEL